MKTPVIIALFALLACGALLHLAQYDLLPRDEPRVAEIAREMVLTNDWITPRLCGKPFLEKPPLHFWLMALAFKIGRVSPFWARLPSALLALAIAVLVFFWTCQSHDRPTAVVAAFMWMTFLEVYKMSHRCLVDMSLAASVTLALFLYWRIQPQKRPRYWQVVPFYLAVGLAFMAKGPLGPVLIGIVVLPHLIKHQGPKALWRWHPFTALLTFGLVTAPWLVALYYQAGPHALHTLLVKNTLGRFLPFGKSYVPHQAPCYYYLIKIWKDALPWSPFLPLVLGEVYQQTRQQRLSPVAVFRWWWAGIMFFSLSLSGGKRSYYLLPLYPALAMGMAPFFYSWLQASWIDWRDLARQITMAVLLIIPAIAVLVLYIVLAPATIPLGGIVCIFLALCAFWLWRQLRQKHIPSFICGFMAFVWLIHIVCGLLILPYVGKRKSLAPVCQRIGRLIGSRQLAVLDIRELYRGALPFYLRRTVSEIEDGQVADYLQADQPRALLIRDDQRRLVQKLIEQHGYHIQALRILKDRLYLVTNS